MKIGVNARLLTKPFTGIGQYTRHLLAELAKIDPKNEYILVVPEKVEIKFPKNVRVVVLPEIGKGGAGVRKTWWEQIAVPKFFEKEKVEMAVFTYPANPWAESWYKKGIKTIVTVHDCIPWTEKNYRPGVLSSLYHGQTKKAVQKADMVLTVSQHSQKEIERVCKVAPEKIKVIYNDANSEFKKAISDAEIERVLSTHGLKRNRYFIYCGGYDQRKNVGRLIEEYGRFTEENEGGGKNGRAQKEAIDLVLVGGKLFENKFYASYDQDSAMSGRIVRPGFLAAKELAALYRGALAFVHLSKEEGFNIPLLEAANCGTPLILSDIEVHREVAGSAAIFVDLEKKDAVSKAMAKMMKEDEREKLSRKSKALAGKYSWGKSAQQLKEVLYLAHGKH